HEMGEDFFHEGALIVGEVHELDAEGVALRGADPAYVARGIGDPAVDRAPFTVEEIDKKPLSGLDLEAGALDPRSAVREVEHFSSERPGDVASHSRNVNFRFNVDIDSCVPSSLVHTHYYTIDALSLLRGRGASASK